MNKKFLAIVAVYLLFLILAASSFALAHDDNRGRSGDNRPEAIHQFEDRAKDLRREIAEEKLNFERTKDKLRNLKREATSEVRSELLAKAKKVAIKMLDRAVNRLEKLKNRIQNSPVISADRKTALTSEVNSQIVELTDFKSQINAASDSEHLKTVIASAREKIKSIKELVKRIVQEILASHIDKAITRLEDVAQRLGTRIDQLRAQGVETGAFERSLSEAQAAIAQAREQNGLKDYQGAKRSVQRAHTLLAKLNGQLKAAGAKLKEGTGSAATRSGRPRL